MDVQKAVSIFLVYDVKSRVNDLIDLSKLPWAVNTQSTQIFVENVSRSIISSLGKRKEPFKVTQSLSQQKLDLKANGLSW